MTFAAASWRASRTASGRVSTMACSGAACPRRCVSVGTAMAAGGLVYGGAVLVLRIPEADADPRARGRTLPPPPRLIGRHPEGGAPPLGESSVMVRDLTAPKAPKQRSDASRAARGGPDRRRPALPAAGHAAAGDADHGHHRHPAGRLRRAAGALPRPALAGRAADAAHGAPDRRGNPRADHPVVRRAGPSVRRDRPATSSTTCATAFARRPAPSRARREPTSRTTCRATSTSRASSSARSPRSEWESPACSARRRWSW